MRYLLDCFREAWKEARPGGCKKAAECLFEQNLYSNSTAGFLSFDFSDSIITFQPAKSSPPILFAKATMSIQRNSEGDGQTMGELHKQPSCRVHKGRDAKRRRAKKRGRE